MAKRRHKFAGMTVTEILEKKKGSIKDAALDEGAPTWDEIADMPWEEIVDRAKRREPGYQTFKKLLSGQEYDK